MTLQTRALDTGSNLRGVHIPPGGKGRVIILDAPYDLPEGMDLRGIAGVILKRPQNAATAAAINAMDDAAFANLRKQQGVFNASGFSQKEQMGPHAPPPFDLPDLIKDELGSIAATFLKLTGAKQTSIHFPSTPASPRFHIDGANNDPSWRLTYAFSGAQTLWHTAIRSEANPVIGLGGTGFPVLTDDQVGVKNKDFFAAEGPLMFLTYSANGLFHKPPVETPRRLVATLDTNAPRRPDCSRSCPFPCR